MTSVQHWTPEQWAVFAVTIAAGVVAAGLLYAARSAVLGWTAPAPLRHVAHTSTPRPSLVLAQQRAPLPELTSSTDWVAAALDRARPLPVIVGAGGVENWVDPTMADFTDHGIGALPTIQIMTVDPTLKTSAELHAELDAWVNAYADLSSLMPETDAARETMRVNLEPCLRKARAWRLRGERGRELNDWRMNTPTGEWPMLTTADLAPYARALLAS
jgi:hypothetical protein